MPLQKITSEVFFFYCVDHNFHFVTIYCAYLYITQPLMKSHLLLVSDFDDFCPHIAQSLS